MHTLQVTDYELDLLADALADLDTTERDWLAAPVKTSLFDRIASLRQTEGAEAHDESRWLEPVEGVDGQHAISRHRGYNAYVVRDVSGAVKGEHATLDPAREQVRELNARGGGVRTADQLPAGKQR
jgi:hypothetical protein